MTDTEVLTQVLSCIDPTAVSLPLIRRNGHILLALPENRTAAARTLRLYQPQRQAARLMVNGLQCLVTCGLHPRIPWRWEPSANPQPSAPHDFATIPKTCGILLGSSEHRIRRAVASYQTPTGWEVAKVAFGPDGVTLLEREAQTLDRLSHAVVAAPSFLGLHHGDGMSVLRMPYLTGRPIKAGDFTAALALLETWVSNHPLMRADQFTEWDFIQRALNCMTGAERALGQLSELKLKPVICHGDFARWNLLQQPNGNLVVLDWEWGLESGMPGLDLVHYFLQDARLVKRLPDKDAISATLTSLRLPQCREYLGRTGWDGDPLLPLIASLAFKQGAGHQDNREILKSAISLTQSMTHPPIGSSHR
jgi:hypothetical protein